MTKIKLLALDLDGTLLRDDKSISDENKLALKKAKRAGVKVVITTGRPLKAIEHILDELDLRDDADYSITFNGGLVQKNTGEILSKKSFTYEELAEIYTAVSKLGLPFDVLSDERVFETNSKSLYRGVSPFLSFTATTFEAMPRDRVFNKAITAFDATYLDQKIPEIPAELFEKYEIFKSRDILLEYMPKNVVKSYGLASLIDILGISREEVMAMGDEENDLPMLSWAGHSIAMKNAVPAAKAAASETAPYTNEENGVAWAVNTYILED
ncbi:Cof-type HAD-IIB family hydrolase [Lactococcus insecticola]|uniref:Haloacid dehalogenase n=1 Tax=Pseudolactococcus insecticola TaxID=2709158 RepID=A0A6A0B7L0_9LACT|nr:Cof-type HAD-IIB family hydrolase [Lactococcus insecticola]GFH40334.1 haloacid dehalogenase [Lactococcus insecticola]